MAAGLLRDDLFRAVEGFMQSLDDLGAPQSPDRLLYVRYLHEQKRRSFVDGLRKRVRRIGLHAGKRLIHKLDAAFLEGNKADVITFRHLDDDLEAKSLGPELDARLDRVDVKYRGGSVDHIISLLWGLGFADEARCKY